MAPILRDDGPPVSRDTIQEARDSLPLEYGFKFAGSETRRVLLVRVPRAKPDYNYELADVALYVSLDEMKNVSDVILVGDEKSVRMDPIRLRDHVREQVREDQDAGEDFIRRLARDYGHTVHVSRINMNHRALAIRIPRESVREMTEEDVERIRDLLLDDGLVGRVKDCQVAYVVADTDVERMGRRVFVSLVLPEKAEDLLAHRHNQPANPLHLAHALAGGTLAGAPEASEKKTPTKAYTPPSPATPQVLGHAPKGSPTMVAAEPGGLWQPRAPAARPAQANPAAEPVAPPPTVPAPHPPRQPLAPPARPASLFTPPADAAPATRAEDGGMNAEPPRAEPERVYETLQDNNEYEVVASKPQGTDAATWTPASEPAPAPQAQAAPEPAGGMSADLPDTGPERAYQTLEENDEFEVVVSKPKGENTPPPMPPMQATPEPEPEAAPAPAPQPEVPPMVRPLNRDGSDRFYETLEENDEYEVIVTKPTGSASAPGPAQVPPPPPPREERAAAPKVAKPQGPSHDNGAPMEPVVQSRLDEVAALRDRFAARGYEVMTAVSVLGHTFDLAAHKADGKRILAKRFEKVETGTVETLSKVADELGADVCMAITRDVEEGVRLATWGTKVMVVSPEEASKLTL